MYGTNGMNFYYRFGGSAGWDETTGLGYVDLGAGKLNAGGIMRVAERDLARILLHEIIHTATKGRTGFSRYGGYTDVEVARAIFKITGDEMDNPDDPRNNPSASHPTKVGGVIFDRALKKYCK